MSVAICSYRIREYAGDPDTQQYSTIPPPPPLEYPVPDFGRCTSHATGSRCAATTSAPPRARTWRPVRMCPCSTRSLPPAATSAPAGARRQRRGQNSLRAGHRGAVPLGAVLPQPPEHLLQRLRTRLRRTGTSRAPRDTSACPGARPEQRVHQSQCHRYRRRAPRWDRGPNMTKCVKLLRAKAKAESMAQSQARTGSKRFLSEPEIGPCFLLLRLLIKFDALCQTTGTRAPAPTPTRAGARPQRRAACECIPRAVVHARPPQHLHISVPRDHCARPRDPRVAVPVGPSQ